MHDLVIFVCFAAALRTTAADAHAAVCALVEMEIAFSSFGQATDAPAFVNNNTFNNNTN